MRALVDFRPPRGKKTPRVTIPHARGANRNSLTQADADFSNAGTRWRGCPSASLGDTAARAYFEKETKSDLSVAQRRQDFQHAVCYQSPVRPPGSDASLWRDVIVFGICVTYFDVGGVNDLVRGDRLLRFESA